jgi:hypothetical protein
MQMVQGTLQQHAVLTFPFEGLTRVGSQYTTWRRRGKVLAVAA